MQHPTGCTLEQYAEAKKLPLEFLQQEVGLTQITYNLAPGRHCLYGQDRLGAAVEAGQVIVVEGPSDTQTLWFVGFPALGLPSANGWNERRDARLLDGIETIYLVVERDEGGERVLEWLERSSIRDRVKLVDLGEAKDISDLYLADPERFRERLETTLAAAVPWPEHQRARAAIEGEREWVCCRDLAERASILDEVATELQGLRVVGEDRLVKLVYLATTSRLLARPVSLAVKGPSSAGKSYATQQTLKLFPAEACYELTAMSERALVYSDEPLEHRILVIYEAAGLTGDFASYIVRSLLSDGRVRYETVEKTRDGLQARLIEREGPTGLIVTTTQIDLHPENETRLLAVNASDSPEQTKAIMLALGDDVEEQADQDQWHALQRWLIPPIAVRLRRDITTIRTLIEAHALLHRASRQCDEQGRIVATIADYVAVRDLVNNLIAEGVDATVPPTIRETVEAVPAGEEGISVRELAHKLGLDKSAGSRRWQAARDKGYLTNLEERKGRLARIVRAEPLPDDIEILPPPEALEDDRCTVASVSEGIPTPLPPRAGDAGQDRPDLPKQAPDVDPARLRELAPGDDGYLAAVHSAYRFGQLPDRPHLRPRRRVRC